MLLIFHEMVSNLKVGINMHQLTTPLLLVFRYQMLGEMNFRECESNGWTNNIPVCEGRCKTDLQVY